MSTIIYDSFIKNNVAPYSAAAIGVFNSNGETEQYRIMDNEEVVITESGSNKRAQFGSSSSSYTSGTIIIKMKFKLKYS